MAKKIEKILMLPLQLEALSAVDFGLRNGLKKKRGWPTLLGSSLFSNSII
jgi:hypothetical protein